MKNRMRKNIEKTLALIFFIVGVVTLPLPFIPGILFIALSLYLFSLHSPKTQERITYFRKRYIILDRTLLYVEDGFNKRKRSKEDVLPREEI